MMRRCLMIVLCGIATLVCVALVSCSPSTATPTLAATATVTQSPAPTSTATQPPTVQIMPTHTATARMEFPSSTPSATPASTTQPTPTPTATAMSHAPIMAVASTGVNLRAGPGTQYAKVGGLAQGQKCEILCRTDDGEWYQIRLPAGNIAWVAAAYVSTSSDAAIPTAQPTAIPPAPTFTPTPAGQFARVTNVVDGDTIDVEIAGQTFRVRYIGMNTPERGQPFFSESTAANEQLVAGQTVRLEKDVSETDRYGRLLRYVYLQDGTFVNAELVRLGYAQAATYPPDIKHQELFLQLQAEARNAGRGLWAQPASTPTPVPAPTATPQPALPAGQVVISYVYYDGQVPYVESDEYAEIKNTGGAAVNLQGWKLNAGDRGQDFHFPSFELQPGQACRVYTNKYYPEYCGFSFGSGRAIWNNKGDCGLLYDAEGALVSEYCY